MGRDNTGGEQNVIYHMNVYNYLVQEEIEKLEQNLFALLLICDIPLNFSTNRKNGGGAGKKKAKKKIHFLSHIFQIEDLVFYKFYFGKTIEIR